MKSNSHENEHRNNKSSNNEGYSNNDKNDEKPMIKLIDKFNDNKPAFLEFGERSYIIIDPSKLTHLNGFDLLPIDSNEYLIIDPTEIIDILGYKCIDILPNPPPKKKTPKKHDLTSDKTLEKIYRNEFQSFVLDKTQYPNPTQIDKIYLYGLGAQSFKDISERYFYRHNCYQIYEKIYKMNKGFDTLARFDGIQGKTAIPIKFFEKRKNWDDVVKEKEELIKIEENKVDEKWLKERKKSLEELKLFLNYDAMIKAKKELEEEEKRRKRERELEEERRKQEYKDLEKLRLQQADFLNEKMKMEFKDYGSGLKVYNYMEKNYKTKK